MIKFLFAVCLAAAYCVQQGRSKYFNHFVDPQHRVRCNEKYNPPFCDLPNVPLSSLGTVEDFERCAPAVLPFPGRNYFWGTGGRKLSYYRNIYAFDDVEIRIRNLRDVSETDLSTTVLGSKISLPFGVSPAAAQYLAHPEGEHATARAAVSMNTVMILSCLASAPLESVAAAARAAANYYGNEPVLWMQIYILRDRSETLQIALRAKANGFKALVMTCDAPMFSTLACDGGSVLEKIPISNLYNATFRQEKMDRAASFADITWLRRETGLPIVAKGIFNGEDAVRAVEAGASAIFVSNHGGRQEDTVPPTINVVEEVIDAVHAKYPDVEVYMDSGVRAGQHIFKALAKGARAVFFGRGQLWGLAVAGEAGVRQVISIMKQELNETMILAGVNKATEITRDHIYPKPFTSCTSISASTY